MPPLRTDDVAALARKYRMLASLRRDREAGAPVPPREVFRDLADEFPGALRELDTLPMDAITTRLAALEICVAGEGEHATWMAIELAHHAWMRAALMLKRRLRKKRAVSDADAERMARDATERVGVEVDVAFVREVASPPEGRLRVVVMERVAAACGVTVEEARRTLFGDLRDR